jgi:hypothetical protein
VILSIGILFVPKHSNSIVTGLGLPISQDNLTSAISANLLATIFLAIQRA